MRVGRDTFGDPLSKGLTKLAILPDYKRPGMLCLALPDLRRVCKLDFQSEFSMSKIIRIFLIFFFIKKLSKNWKKLPTSFMNSPLGNGFRILTFFKKFTTTVLWLSFASGHGGGQINGKTVPYFTGQQEN